MFTGRHSESEKWVECAVAALGASKSSLLRNSMQLNRESSKQNSQESGEDREGKRSRSIDLFLRHRRAEIEYELESITESLSVIKANKNQISSDITSRIGLFQSLSRVLHFGYDGKGDFDNCEKKNKEKDAKKSANKKVENDDVGLTSKLIYALRDKFGLDRVQKRSDHTGGMKNNNEIKNEKENQILMKMKNEVVKKVLRSVSEDTGFIDYMELFSDISMDSHDDSDEEEEEGDGRGVKGFALDQLPVNIEICSGSGEWVVAHASADLYYPHKGKDQDQDQKVKNSKDKTTKNNAVPRALWLALELRCDRVYHTISRSVIENIVRHSHHANEITRNKSYHEKNTDTNKVSSTSFSGLSNLAIIGGDATNILPNRIAPGSITSVYINHPEPPERTGGVGDSEGQHLLTQEFFSEIHRILKSTGTCTIVTDNLPYAKSLLQALAKTTTNSLKSTDSSLFPCFISVSLDSVNNNDKSDKRILEEEIKVGAKLITKNEEIVSKKKKNVSRKTMKDSDDDDDEDDDEEEENKGEGGEEVLN